MYEEKQAVPGNVSKKDFVGLWRENKKWDRGADGTLSLFTAQHHITTKFNLISTKLRLIHLDTGSETSLGARCVFFYHSERGRYSINLLFWQLLASDRSRWWDPLIVPEQTERFLITARREKRRSIRRHISAVTVRCRQALALALNHNLGTEIQSEYSEFSFVSIAPNQNHLKLLYSVR